MRYWRLLIIVSLVMSIFCKDTNGSVTCSESLKFKSGRFIKFIESQDAGNYLLYHSSFFLKGHKISEQELNDPNSIEGISSKLLIVLSLGMSLLSIIISLSLIVYFWINKEKSEPKYKTEANNVKQSSYPYPALPGEAKVYEEISTVTSETGGDEEIEQSSSISENTELRFQKVQSLNDDTGSSMSRIQFFVTDYSELIGPGAYTEEDLQTKSKRNSYFRITLNSDRTSGKIEINPNQSVVFEPVLSNTDRLQAICDFIPDTSKDYIAIKELRAGEIKIESGIYNVTKKIKIELIEGN